MYLRGQLSILSRRQISSTRRTFVPSELLRRQAGEGGSLPLDLLAGLLVFVVSSAVFVHAYRTVSRLEIRPDGLLSHIPAGDSQFRVVQDGSCVGTILLTARDRELTELLLSGSMRLNPQTASAAGSKELAFRLSGFFNPLGQLFRATATVDFPGFDAATGPLSASAAFANTHPIDLSVVVKSQMFEYQRELKLPGPISVEKRAIAQKPEGKSGIPAQPVISPGAAAVRSHYYSVSYQALEAVLTSTALPGLSPQLGERFIDRLKLQVEVVQPSEPLCGAYPAGAVSVQAAQASLQETIPGVNSYLLLQRAVQGNRTD